MGATRGCRALRPRRAARGRRLRHVERDARPRPARPRSARRCRRRSPRPSAGGSTSRSSLREVRVRGRAAERELRRAARSAARSIAASRCGGTTKFAMPICSVTGAETIARRARRAPRGARATVTFGGSTCDRQLDRLARRAGERGDDELGRRRRGRARCPACAADELEREAVADEPRVAVRAGRPRPRAGRPCSRRRCRRRARPARRRPAKRRSPRRRKPRTTLEPPPFAVRRVDGGVPVLLTPSSVGLDLPGLRAGDEGHRHVRAALARAARAAPSRPAGVIPPTSTPAIVTPSASLSGEPAKPDPTPSTTRQAPRRRGAASEPDLSAAHARLPPAERGAAVVEPCTLKVLPMLAAVAGRDRASRLGDTTLARMPSGRSNGRLGWRRGLRAHRRAAADPGDGPARSSTSGSCRSPSQNDIDHKLDMELIEGMAELGILGIVIPEAYGGAGLDFVCRGARVRGDRARRGGVPDADLGARRAELAVAPAVRHRGAEAALARRRRRRARSSRASG